jgi:hypothetical protein
LSLGPVLDFKLSEASEVLGVDGNEYKAVHVSNRSDLAVHIRCGSTKGLEMCPLVAVPRGGNFFIG